MQSCNTIRKYLTRNIACESQYRKHDLTTRREPYTNPRIAFGSTHDVNTSAPYGIRQGETPIDSDTWGDIKRK
jgi:hypothetical protein